MSRTIAAAPMRSLVGALPLWGVLALLTLAVSLVLAYAYFEPDPPRYAWGMLVIAQAILISAGTVSAQDGLGDLLRMLQSRVAPMSAGHAALQRLRRLMLQLWGGTRRRWLGLRILAQSLEGSLVLLLLIAGVAGLCAPFGFALWPGETWS